MNRIIIFISLLCGISGISQEIASNIERLESTESDKQGTILYAKQDVNGDIYVVTKLTGLTQLGYSIKHFSKDAKFLEESFIEIHKSEIIGLVLSEDSINLVQFSYNFDTKSYDLSIISSNKEKLNFKETIIYSIERGNIDKYENFGLDEKPEIREYDSTDFKKYGFFQEGENGRNSVFALCLKENSYTILKLDDALKLIETYSVSGDKKSATVFEDIAIDENGDVYFLERKYNNNSGKKYDGDKVDYYLNLHKFSSNSIDKTLKIDLDKNIVDVKILNNGAYFSLGGIFYTENDVYFKVKFIGGMFRANIDKKAMAIDVAHYIPFSLHLDIVKRGSWLQKHGGLYSPKLKSIFLYENGDLILSTEEEYKTTSGNHTFSNNNEIFVMKVNANGLLVWDKLVQKIQGTGLGVMGNNYFSYLSNLNEDKSIFVFNGHKDIKRTSENEYEFQSSAVANSLAYVLEIDNTGSASHKTVISNVEDIFVLEVKTGIFITENTFLAQGKLNGDRSLFKIKI